MTTADAVDQGRKSFRRQAWANAYSQLSAADHNVSLEPGDLERLATAAYLTGRDADSEDIWARAHHECLRQGDAPRAARCAFWLAFGLLNKGEMAPAMGWFARAQRLLDDGQHDCVERGYLLLPVAVPMVDKDAATACATFLQAAEIGARFNDLDLVAIARVGRGRALIRLGEATAGLAIFDEVMAGVMAGELSAVVVGDVYCIVVEGCFETLDLRRAQEWTAALSRWCVSQPDLVPFRGQCLVFRTEIMQLHGAWTDAIDEAQRACKLLSDQPAVGEAFYQRAELHRLRGEFIKAEEAYRQANQGGRTPQPGLAQLRLAQGQVDAAKAGIRRGMDDAQDRVTQSSCLAAYVEIMLSAGDVEAARAAADDLARLATDLDPPFLQALSARAKGAVLIAQGDARAALAALRHAWTAWQELEAPYEAARVRVLVGLACRQLGDEDSAEMELDAARWVFQQLGAAPDLARVEALTRKAAVKSAGGLTDREVQVLRLVAAGKTNRSIAADLFLSEKTVARHVSNMFTKLGLSSRSAATAYAYEQHLV